MTSLVNLSCQIGGIIFGLHLAHDLFNLEQAPTVIQNLAEGCHQMLRYALLVSLQLVILPNESRNKDGLDRTSVTDGGIMAKMPGATNNRGVATQVQLPAFTPTSQNPRPETATKAEHEANLRHDIAWETSSMYSTR
jgi:hypothetical protein